VSDDTQRQTIMERFRAGGLATDNKALLDALEAHPRMAGADEDPRAARDAYANLAALATGNERSPDTQRSEQSADVMPSAPVFQAARN
jgi:hypothetical protein